MRVWEELELPAGGSRLHGALGRVPVSRRPTPAVAVAHGARHGTRSAPLYRHLADRLRRDGVATLLFDRRTAAPAGQTGITPATLADDLRSWVGLVRHWGSGPRSSPRPLFARVHTVAYHGVVPLVQVRDVPDATVAALKARAADQGLTLTGYLRKELERLAAVPSNAEIAERLARRDRRGGPTVTDTVAEIRRTRAAS